MSQLKLGSLLAILVLLSITQSPRLLLTTSAHLHLTSTSLPTARLRLLIAIAHELAVQSLEHLTIVRAGRIKQVFRITEIL